MFVSLLRLISRPPADPRSGFVETVTVHERVPRNAGVERLILVCWVLIAIKHVGIIWVCRHYPVPFHQLWVNFPTWLLGVLATGIYYGRVARR
jgi:hypothetical protein